MHVGRTLFAQVMDFLPWTTFQRIVDSYQGDHRVRTLTCAEQFRCMAFAQITYRESLRDIEACHSGPPKRRSSCIHCSICAEPFRPSSTSPMANCTMSMSSTC